MIRPPASSSARCENAWGKLPEVPAGVDVELLGVEPQRRGNLHQLLHQVAGALRLADDRERRDQPERADHERPLLAGQAVVGLVGAVAQHEPVLGQLIGDRQHARPQDLVVAWEEPEDRGQQRRGVERLGVVVLAQHASLVDAVLEDVGLDLRGGLCPGRLRGRRRRECRRACTRGPSPPSTSASRTHSAAAYRAPPRSPDRACATPRSRTRPATAINGHNLRGRR